jgi:putative phosphoesterase
VRIGLISDTHGRLRPGVFKAFEGVELILHAGDVGPMDIIIELEAIAPVHAVLGNTDLPVLKPRVLDVVELELEGKKIVVVHGHQVGAPTPERLREAHPNADIIVYGHTHRQRVDHHDGCVIINPGAAGPPRFDLKPAVAILTLVAGSDPAIESIPLA